MTCPPPYNMGGSSPSPMGVNLIKPNGIKDSTQ